MPTAPARIDAASKRVLLDLIEQTSVQGCSGWTCGGATGRPGNTPKGSTTPAPASALTS
jgi:hypothetical protein